MKKKTITAGLVIMLALQLFVLAAEYAGAVLPLWTGQEIRLKTVPIDPRSLFRGNYAQLRYDISTIPELDGNSRKMLRAGETVYVRLKQDENGIFSFDGAGLEKPDRGPFIRGRLQETTPWANRGNYEIRYGIEAYFAPREKALALEKNLRGGGIAVVMVSDSGRATLKDVIAQR